MLEEEKKNALNTFNSPTVVFEGAKPISDFLSKPTKKKKTLSDMIYVFRLEASGKIWHITKQFREILKFTSSVSSSP